MTKVVPLAVIGCGLIGLRHAQVAQDLGEVDLTAVVEPDATLRQRLKQQGLPVVASIADVPKRTKAAIIATPTPAHADAGLAAIDRGWAVLVEKPIAGTLLDADRLIDVADRAGLPLVTGHHRRCHPFVQATTERLARIGTLVGVQGMWSLRKDDAYYLPDWRRAPGSGPLMTNLSHEIDLLRLFLGEIELVSALSSDATRGHQIEDSSSIAIRFTSGALASFLMSDAGASPWSFEAACGENPHIAMSGEDYIRFTGTDGAMSFPSLSLWLGTDGQDVNWHNPLERHHGLRFDSIDPIRSQLKEFVDLIDGNDTGILANGQDGRAVLEATLAAVMSAELGHPVAMGDVTEKYCGLAA